MFVEVTGYKSNLFETGQSVSSDQPTNLLDVALPCLDRLEELKELLMADTG